MPKRSKIVSGKVISAVEKSRSKIEASKAEPISASDAISITAAAAVPTGDIKSRFQMRKEELETSRKANDPINMRRAEKRRAAEEKKKSKHQQKRLVETSSKDKTSADSNDAKRVKSSSAEKSSGAIEEGNFVFNRLDENEKGSSSGGAPVKKTISDPKQALQKLQAQKDKLAKLKATDSVKAAALEEKLQLKKALQKAEGVSIKDDVNLLKKSIQRREKEKSKSRETWIQKKTDQKEVEDKRQSKRTENIQSRIDAKKNKKMGIKVKKTVKKSQKPPGKGGAKFNKKK